MFAWIGSISNIFGYVLNFIYELVGNYGVAILLFTLLAKLLLVPLTYFQQKNMKKTSLISEEVKKAQEKYKGNDKKIQEETMKIYKDNNTSPLAGCSSCITVILQMILILAMFYLVSEPLKYMRNIDPEMYKQYEIRMYEEVIAEKEAQKEENNEENNNENEEEKAKNTEEENVDENENEEKTEEQRIRELRAKSGVLRPQMEMIARYRDENEVFDINTKFLGLDLTQIPTNSLKSFKINDKDTYIALVNLIIPVLYMGVSIYNLIYTNKKAKKEKEAKTDPDVIVLETKEVETVKDDTKKELAKKDDEKLNSADVGDAMKDANKTMLYFLPIIMFTVTMSAPLSLALYWLTNTLLSFVEKEIVDLIINKKDKKADVTENTIIATKVKKEKKK